MNLYRLCFLSSAGVQYHSTETFPKERAEWHMRNLDRLDGSVVWIEWAEWKAIAA